MSERDRVSVRAIKSAQALISALAQEQLVADGWWGSYTNTMFEGLAPDDRSRVESLVGSFNRTTSRLKTESKVDVLNKSLTKVDAVKLRNELIGQQKVMAELVKRVAISEGVDPVTALKICWLESRFDPNALSPSKARGLFQFTTIAVKDVLRRGGFDLRGREFDPEANAIAGMRYIKIVAKTLGVSTSDTAKVYMGFNIGPTAAQLYSKGIYSEEVRALIRGQAYGSTENYGSNLLAAVAKAPILA